MSRVNQFNGQVVLVLLEMTIRTTPNSIGYVELACALTTGMTVGSLQKQAGSFIEPTLESTKAAAAASAPQLPAGDQSWSSITMVNAPVNNHIRVLYMTLCSRR